MLLHIIARGKIGKSPEAELVARYEKRMTWPFAITELPESGGKDPPPPPANSRRVLLDETGRDMTSTAFADVLRRWRDDGVREARFCIGGADGFDDVERASADLLVSFGRLTWPHMLARAMLAEQLYRATTIIAGHPYHREG